MDQSSKTVEVRILDKIFRLACRPEAEPALKEAAFYLDNQMRKVKQQGRVIGLERVAIVAGLNIANELLQRAAAPRDPAGEYLPDQGITNRLQMMQQKIDNALAQTTTRQESCANALEEVEA